MRLKVDLAFSLSEPVLVDQSVPLPEGGVPATGTETLTGTITADGTEVTVYTSDPALLAQGQPFSGFDRDRHHHQRSEGQQRGHDADASPSGRPDGGQHRREGGQRHEHDHHVYEQNMQRHSVELPIDIHSVSVPGGTSEFPELRRFERLELASE